MFKKCCIGLPIWIHHSKYTNAYILFYKQFFSRDVFWSILLNFNYASSINMSIMHRLYMTITEKTYLPIYVIVFIGSMYVLLSKIDIRLKIYYILTFVFSMFVVAYSYIGINFFHYNIYMLPFMIPFFIVIFRLFDKYHVVLYNNIVQCVYIILILLTIIFVNKMLSRTKPELRDTERQMINNIQQDYDKNHDLKVFAHSNENYIAYCYTDVVPPKGIVVCSMFLSTIDDVYYIKLHSLLYDGYDYIVLYNLFISQFQNDKFGLSTEIKQMLEKEYKVIVDDLLISCYKKNTSKNN